MKIQKSVEDIFLKLVSQLPKGTMATFGGLLEAWNHQTDTDNNTSFFYEASEATIQEIDELSKMKIKISSNGDDKEIEDQLLKYEVNTDKGAINGIYDVNVKFSSYIGQM